MRNIKRKHTEWTREFWRGSALNLVIDHFKAEKKRIFIKN